LNDPRVEGSLSSRFRNRRWHDLLQAFPDLASMRVLDLGGTVDHWESGPVKPSDVVLLNLGGDAYTGPGIRMIHGDACDPPDELRSEKFDLVYSNSLIEHVGGFSNRIAVAENVHSFAPRHWVQTPYRYFPVEPHWLFPGLQFLPIPLRVKAAQRWPLGWSQPEGRDNVAHVLNVELLTRTEMHFLFPDSEIAEERAAGLCKSLIALQR
jgi:hypothetical protein